MNVARRLTVLAPSLKKSCGVSGCKSFHRWVSPTLKTMYRRKERLGPQDPQPRNTFAEWNYDSELYAFGHRLKENFDKDILKTALLCRSYVEQQEKDQKEVGIEPDLQMKDNTEMSVNGEKLISLYVEQYLTTTLSKLPKKYMRNIRDYLVNDSLLAYIAKELGMADLILTAEFPVSEPTLAQSLKSVVQALAESSGQDRACMLVRDLVVTQLVGQDITQFCTPENPLKELEEHLKASGQEPPEPRLISVIGRNTILASYDVGIYSNKIMIGRGFGESAEIAQDMAACDALWKSWDVGSRRKPLPFKLELPPLDKFVTSAANSA